MKASDFAELLGIDPALEPQVSDLQDGQASVLQTLVAGRFDVVVGRDLAMAIGAMPGEAVTLISPSGQSLGISQSPSTNAANTGSQSPRFNWRSL